MSIFIVFLFLYLPFTSFRISIYRKEAETDAYGVVRPATDATESATNEPETATNRAIDEAKTATNRATETTNIKLSKNELTLLHYVKDHPTATQREAANGTGITIGTIKRLFPSLQKKMALKRNGNHKDGSWEILISIPD